MNEKDENVESELNVLLARNLLRKFDFFDGASLGVEEIEDRGVGEESKGGRGGVALTQGSKLSDKMTGIFPL